jgi:two-component sensor histidine kinase
MLILAIVINSSQMKQFLFIFIIVSVFHNWLICQSPYNPELINGLANHDTIAYLSSYNNSKYKEGSVEKLGEDLLHHCVFLNQGCQNIINSIPNNLSEKDKSYLLDIAMSLMAKVYKDKSIFYKTAELGVKISKKFDDLRMEYYYLSAQSTLANMTKDYERMGNVILEISSLPFQKDSFIFSKYILQKALFAKYQNKTGIDSFFQISLDIGMRHMVGLGDTLVMATTFRDYANYLKTKGDLTQAIKLLNKGFRLIPDDPGLILNKLQISINLSEIYLDLGNYTKSKFYVEEAENQALSSDLKSALDTKVASQYGNYFAAMGEHQQAIINHKISYKKFSGKWLNNIDPAISAYKIGLSYIELDSLIKANKWFEIAGMYDINSVLATYLSALLKSKILLTNKNYNKSEAYALKAIEASRRLNSKQKEKECLELLYTINKKANRNRESLAYLEDYIKLDEYVYRSGQELAVNELQTEYEIDLREEKINTLNAHNEATNTKLTAQKTLTLFTTVVLLVLSALLFFLYKLNKKLKDKNELITKANDEKKILLKEIHHRVKNNLQVISSLLKLQSRYIRDDNAIKAIAEGRSRVQSMALLHQNLYQDDNLKGVNMRQYFSNLIQGLFDAYNIEEDRITLETDIQDISLDVDTVIPLGLITNELVSNSLKHAFTNKLNGEIIVKLVEVGGKLILEVSDNGSGQDFTKESSGFGRMLIDSLSTKLDAEILKSTEVGTSYKIIISDYQIAA